MSQEVHPLRERLIKGIKRKKADILSQRINAVQGIFRILTNTNPPITCTKDQIVSLSENLILDIDEITRCSLEYHVESTRGSLCEQDSSFGTSVVNPVSIATMLFLEEIPKIFSNYNYQLQKYAEVKYCPKCNQKTKGEFGFFVENPELNRIGFHGANIRIFAIETYPCDCKR